MGELAHTSRRRMNANGGDSVTIKTPARLHFALIDLNGSLGRIDGSIGLAINDPHFEIIAEPADRIQIESVQYEERARAILEKLQVKYSFPGIHLQLVSEIPPHSGFGSGTQLALSIAQAVNTLYNLNLSVADLAEAVGRGGTSGIGITAFERGGFILDGGHRFPDQKSSFLPSSAAGNVPAPPLLLRHPFPDWELLIVIPRCTHISGEQRFNSSKPSALNPDPPPNNFRTSSSFNYCRQSLKRTVALLDPRLMTFRPLVGRRSRLMPKAAFYNRHLTFCGITAQWVRV